MEVRLLEHFHRNEAIDYYVPLVSNILQAFRKGNFFSNIFWIPIVSLSNKTPIKHIQ